MPVPGVRVLPLLTSLAVSEMAVTETLITVTAAVATASASCPDWGVLPLSRCPLPLVLVYAILALTGNNVRLSATRRCFSSSLTQSTVQDEYKNTQAYHRYSDDRQCIRDLRISPMQGPRDDH
jgi:hypothetical protein